MLSNEEIEAYKQLQKQTQEANVDKQTLKTEIKVISEQGLEKLQKYGFESYKDIPKLQAHIEKLEAKVREEAEQMRQYCTYMAEKKMEKLTIFNKD
jgi:hypothetical protein